RSGLGTACLRARLRNGIPFLQALTEPRPSRSRGSKAFSTLLLLTVGVVNGTSLLAHDFWMEPSTFFPQTGQIVSVRLRVGQEMIGDPVPRDEALVKEFLFEDGAGRKPLVGHNGSDPAGLMRVVAPGLMVIGYLSNPSPVEIGAE